MSKFDKKMLVSLAWRKYYQLISLGGFGNIFYVILSYLRTTFLKIILFLSFGNTANIFISHSKHAEYLSKNVYI